MLLKVEFKALKLFERCMSAYLALLCLTMLFDSDSLKQVANVSAVLMVVFLVSKYFHFSKMPIVFEKLFFSVVIFVGAICVSGFVNFQNFDFVISLKLVLYPFLIFSGYNAAKIDQCSGGRAEWSFFAILLSLIPLLALVFQYLFGFSDDYVVSIFPNRNTAALYAVSLAGVYYVYLPDRKFINFYIMVAALSFATMGVFLAALTSFFIVNLKKENFHNFTFAVFGFLFVAYIFSDYFVEIPVVSRIAEGSAVFGAFSIGYLGVINASYLEFVNEFGVQDLSFIFRIKHWDDIFGLWVNSGFFGFFFGSGFGASLINTSEGLVPHNDYLRFAYEGGLLVILSLLYVFKNLFGLLGRHEYAIPFYVIALYMFSENLIDNFPSMVIFYFMSGYCIFGNIGSKVSK